MRADCVSGDSHSFDNSVWVALEYGTIHECARVTLVGVTGYVFHIALRFICKFPFKTGREAAAATSAKPGFLNSIDNLFGRHFCKSFCECLITVDADVFIDVFGVNRAAVTEYESLLFLEEINTLG